jgi:CHASE3 domain sensor protein
MAVADVSSASSGATVGGSTTLGRPARRLPALTTPGWFRLALLVLVAGLVALAVVAVRVVLERTDATNAVVDEATPLLVSAEDLYVALADADAAASTAFLSAGLEPRDLRTRYQDDLDRAGEQLALLAARTRGSAESDAAVTRIGQALLVYAGQVETARTNNRQDFPVGAAYLRRASDSMRNAILPTASGIYEDAARQLYGDYERGTAARGRAVLVVVGGAVLALLVGTQVLVAVRTRRVLNAGLVGATVIVGALGIGALVALDRQQEALVSSQRAGSDQLIVLSNVRILALRSLSDENLDLIERGVEPSYLDDFEANRTHISGEGGLLDEATRLAERTGSTAQVESIRGLWNEYLAVHDRVRQLDEAGVYQQAVRVAVNDGAGAAADLDAALDSEIDAARNRLDADALAARRQMRWLVAVVVAAIVAAALLVAWGLWVRIREYR